MRSRWPTLTLLCLLASLLVPGIASASVAAGAETRVWAFDLASDSLLAAREGAHWGNPRTLARLVRDDGAGFVATNADDYARQASDFLRQSQAGRLPTKIDADGVIRVFDPTSNSFGAINPDGTTKTFFKSSGGQSYWDGQPGGAPWTPK